MKKKLLILITSIVLILTGCGVKHVDGELEDIMDRLYNGISEEELPMMLQNTELTEENIENYIGTKDIKWSEAIVSESMVGSIAHSVVLIRMNEDVSEKDIEEAKEIIKEIVRNNRDGSELNVIDLNEDNLDDIILQDTRVFKLQGNLVNLLSENKKVNKQIINEDQEIYEEVKEEVVEEDYEELYNIELNKNKELEKQLNEYKQIVDKIKEIVE